MSRLSKIVNNIPIQVQNRSGFDMSHEHMFTAKVGTLVPAACIEVLPNDSIRLGHMTNVQLPPMATNFFGRVDARIEAFFVPNRLLYGGWQHFITSINEENDEGQVPVHKNIPEIDVASFINYDSESDGYFQYGSLADYLGYKHKIESAPSFKISALPFLAYHRIWNDWYRDSRIQTPCFVDRQIDEFDPATFNWRAANLPSLFLNPLDDNTIHYDNSEEAGAVPRNDSLYDGSSLFSLRQRNYAKDLFTAAALKPQHGEESSVSFQVDDEGKGSFSIAALRAANSLQKFLERNNIAGTRYVDQIKAHFGITPSDAVLQRPLYLGGTTLGVYNKSVLQTSPDASASSPNIFSGLGAKGAFSSALGDDSLIGNFTATEHGFIMVMFSLVPHAVYADGLSPVLRHDSVGSFAFPILAGMGDESIPTTALNTQASDSSVFGYCQRYSNYKYLLDRVSGQFRSTLKPFVLQRPISSDVTLSSSFLEIPTTALDDVAAVEDSISTYGSMVDMYFSLKMVRALPVYSLPTLADEKDVHTVIMDNGGQRL